MTFLRHSARHVHKTFVDYVTVHLEQLGWMDSDATPFGSPVLDIRDVSVLPSDSTPPADVEPGLVTITVGDEDDADDQELGGPLALSEYPMFVDIFMDSDATALAVALDIRDICKGRLPGTVRSMPVTNYALTPPTAEPGWRMELVDIIRVKPESPLKVHWQVVKVTASVEFPEERY